MNNKYSNLIGATYIRHKNKLLVSVSPDPPCPSFNHRGWVWLARLVRRQSEHGLQHQQQLMCLGMDTRAGNGLETSLTSCYGCFMVTTIPFLAHL